MKLLRLQKDKKINRLSKYAKEHPKREQALSAWLYLEKMYFNDSLFKVQKKPIEAIELEKNALKWRMLILLINYQKKVM